MSKITISKSKFKKLYDVACSDWKSKFNTRFKECLFSDEIEFDKNFFSEMKEACDAKQLKVFKDIFKDELKKEEEGKINSLKDACKLLSLDYNEIEKCSATTRLKTIIKAINFIDNGNKVWKANFTSGDYKYLPYFRRERAGWVVYDVGVYYSAGSDCSVGLYFKNKKSAEDAASKFLALYNEFLNE